MHSPEHLQPLHAHGGVAEGECAALQQHLGQVPPKGDLAQAGAVQKIQLPVQRRHAEHLFCKQPGAVHGLAGGPGLNVHRLAALCVIPHVQGVAARGRPVHVAQVGDQVALPIADLRALAQGGRRAVLYLKNGVVNVDPLCAQGRQLGRNEPVFPPALVQRGHLHPGHLALRAHTIELPLAVCRPNGPIRRTVCRRGLLLQFRQPGKGRLLPGIAPVGGVPPERVLQIQHHQGAVFPPAQNALFQAGAAGQLQLLFHKAAHRRAARGAAAGGLYCHTGGEQKRGRQQGTACLPYFFPHIHFPLSKCPEASIPPRS